MLVKRKYRFRCDICRSRKNLEAHHKDSWNKYKRKRYKLSNGVCLCENCHREFHEVYGYGDNTRKQYREFVVMKGAGMSIKQIIKNMVAI